MSELTEHGRKALERCIREHQKFIELADDYDLDEMSVQALQTAIESMQMRLDTSKPVGAEAVVPYGWVLTGPCGSAFIPASHRHVVDATLKGDDCSAVTVYTHPQPVTPAGGEVEARAKAMFEAGTVGANSAPWEQQWEPTKEYWRAKAAHPPVADAALAEAYKQGWLVCTNWASRDDLISDIDSPAYIKARDVSLAALNQRGGGDHG